MPEENWSHQLVPRAGNTGTGCKKNYSCHVPQYLFTGNLTLVAVISELPTSLFAVSSFVPGTCIGLLHISESLSSYFLSISLFNPLYLFTVNEQCHLLRWFEKFPYIGETQLHFFFFFFFFFFVVGDCASFNQDLKSLCRSSSGRYTLIVICDCN